MSARFLYKLFGVKELQFFFLVSWIFCFYFSVYCCCHCSGE